MNAQHERKFPNLNRRLRCHRARASELKTFFYHDLYSCFIYSAFSALIVGVLIHINDLVHEASKSYLSFAASCVLILLAVGAFMNAALSFDHWNEYKREQHAGDELAALLREAVELLKEEKQPPYGG